MRKLLSYFTVSRDYDHEPIQLFIDIKPAQELSEVYERIAHEQPIFVCNDIHFI